MKPWSILHAVNDCNTTFMRTVITCILAMVAGYSAAQTTISKDMNPKTFTCKLTTPELQQRKKTVIAELKSLVIERTEIPSGMKFKFAGSDKTLDLLINFIKTERLCCDFFQFTLSVGDEKSFAWFELTGPEGTKGFIESEIGL